MMAVPYLISLVNPIHVRRCRSSSGSITDIPASLVEELIAAIAQPRFGTNLSREISDGVRTGSTSQASEPATALSRPCPR